MAQNKLSGHGMPQALSAAEVGMRLVSPTVGQSEAERLVSAALVAMAAEAGPALGLGVAAPAVQSGSSEVICACCGGAFVTLKRHLWLVHGLDEAGYRARFGLPEGQALAAQGYLARRAAVRAASHG